MEITFTALQALCKQLSSELRPIEARAYTANGDNVVEITTNGQSVLKWAGSTKGSSIDMLSNGLFNLWMRLGIDHIHKQNQRK